MEAARVASIRGHKVSLFEKNVKLGGHMIEGSVPAFKVDLARLLRWYETELAQLGVNVHLGQEATPELIQREKPDALLISTGWNWAIPDIPGIDKANVATVSDLLLGKKKIEEPVVIMGGGILGCETAFWLAQQGKKVTMLVKVDELMQYGIPVCSPNRDMLLDLLNFHQVKILTNTSPVGITDEGVKVIDKDLRRSVIPARTVVISIGFKPELRLLRALGGNLPNMFIMGNGKQTRNIMSAIWDAYEVARNI
jgi:2-enoate reductase